MAEHPGSSSGAPVTQLEQQQHQGSTMDNFLDIGSIFPQEEQDDTPRSHGNPLRQLVIRQAPEYARVAMGKDKDRKPIDPPPIVELIDRKKEKRSNNSFEIFEHHNPYLFLNCSLVMEDYRVPTNSKNSDPTSYLCGTTTSSIHHHKDPANSSCGFFVFGDLGVKRDGRYRLCFTLYDRDAEINPPEIFFVSEIFSKVFTVASAKSFPGMAESTPLTRCLSDQGVKLRLRKDSRAMKTRKRNQRTAESAELSRQGKRPNISQNCSFRGAMGERSNSLSLPDLTNIPDFSAASGLPTSQSAPNTASNTPLEVSPTGTFMSSPMNVQFSHQGFQPLTSMPDITGVPTPTMTGAPIPSVPTPMIPGSMGASIPGIDGASIPDITTTWVSDMGEATIQGMHGAHMAPSAYHHQGYPPQLDMDRTMAHEFAMNANFVQDSMGGPGPVPGYSMTAPYAVLANHFNVMVPDMAPRTPGVLDEVQDGSMSLKPESDNEVGDDPNYDSINPFQVLQ